MPPEVSGILIVPYSFSINCRGALARSELRRELRRQRVPLLPVYCRVSVPVTVSFDPTWKTVTANCVAVGFKCPENEKFCDPFTFSTVPLQPTLAPVTTACCFTG